MRRHPLLLLAAVATAVTQMLILVPGGRLTAHAAATMQTQYPIRDMNTRLMGIVAGPDGNIWDVDRSGPYLDRLTPSGTLSSFPISEISNGCFSDISNDITAGPDGNLWFTQDCYFDFSVANTLPWGYIGMITPSGTVTHYKLPDAGPAYGAPPYGGSDPTPYGITTGPDGNLWFTESQGNHVGRITTAGVITEYAVPTAHADSRGITAGPDGNLWFVESGAGKVAKLTTSGAITEYPVAAGSQPEGIAAGPDGNLWFTETGTGKLGRIATGGTGYVEFATPSAQSMPMGIVSGPGGQLWFTEPGYGSNSAIASMTTSGAVTEYPVASFGPFDLTVGPNGDIWYTASTTTLPTSHVANSWIGRLPLSQCGELTDTVSHSITGSGAAETVGVQLKNCGVPGLTSVTTSTTITPPTGCTSAPTIPPFTATLAYGQTASGGATIAAPSCPGVYTVTSTTTDGASTLTTGSTVFMVSHGAGSQVLSDFNGDGYADLAIGSSGDGNINGVVYPGAINVYYGSRTGLTATPLQVITATSPGMPSEVASDAGRFGMSLVGADVDHDGYSDLVVGVSSLGYPDSATRRGGAVLIHGTPQGLTTRNALFIAPPAQVRAGASGAPGSWSQSLATGDFNGDGYADVAFGAPYDSEVMNFSGSVTIMYGSAAGLLAAQTVITEASPGWPGTPPARDDGFGWTLSAGDFNHDGLADLSIGAPGRSAAVVLFGSASGMGTAGSQYLQGIGPSSAYTLAAGDFNGDGYSDLAVASACANLNQYRGIVEVHYGSTTGLGSVPIKTAQEFWPTKSGMPVRPTNSVLYFGDQVMAGRFRGGNYDDLVIGTGAGGGFYVLRGAASGLVTNGSRFIADGTYQQTFASGDFNHDGKADLATGEPLGSPFAERPPQGDWGYDTSGDTDVRNGASTGVMSTAGLTLAPKGQSFSVTSQTTENGLCGGP